MTTQHFHAIVFNTDLASLFIWLHSFQHGNAFLDISTTYHFSKDSGMKLSAVVQNVTIQSRSFSTVTWSQTWCCAIANNTDVPKKNCKWDILLEDVLMLCDTRCRQCTHAIVANEKGGFPPSEPTCCDGFICWFNSKHDICSWQRSFKGHVSVALTLCAPDLASQNTGKCWLILHGGGCTI